jgi:hypothetical protein
MWKNGVRNGKGHFESLDGNMQIGEWINDKF